MNYNWQNNAKPPYQGENSWPNSRQYGQNKNVTYHSSYNNPNEASNSYNPQAGGYYNQGNSYNSNAEFGNPRKRSYNSFQGPNDRTYNARNNYDSNKSNQGNSYLHQNPWAYEMGTQFHNDQRSGPYDEGGWHSYDKKSPPYDNRQSKYQNNHMFKHMSKGKERNERKKLKHLSKVLEVPDINKEILVGTKQIIFVQLKESAKILRTPGSSRLRSKTAQVLHDRLRMIIGNDKNPVSETLLQEYRDIYPKSLDERFVHAIKKRMDGEGAEDEAELLSERDIVVMQHTPLTLKDQAVKKQLSQTPSNPQLNLRKKILPPGSTAFQARLTLTVDDIDEAISIRAEQIKTLMLEVDDLCPMDDVHQYVHQQLLDGAGTLIKNQICRMLSKSLIRPDADREFLMLRILGQPKLPPQLLMEEFLEPYTVRELKKSFKNKQLIVVRVKSRKDYEDLLAKDQIVITGLALSIKKADTIKVNIEQYLRKNKTWILTGTKEDQMNSEKKRLRKKHYLALQTIENKKRREAWIKARDQTDMENQEDMDNEKDMDDHQKCVSEGDEGQRDAERQGDMEGQEDAEGQGDVESKGNRKGQEDTEG